MAVCLPKMAATSWVGSSLEGDSRKNYQMRKTDARTVRSSGSLSIAKDGSEKQFGRVKVPITFLFVDETMKCGYSFS